MLKVTRQERKLIIMQTELGGTLQNFFILNTNVDYKKNI